MIPADLNLTAVLVAAVIYFVIGGVWYSPLMFMKPWLALIGKTGKDIQKEKDNNKGMVHLMAATFLSGLVSMFVLAHFVDYLNTLTVVEGAELGFWVWLGFAITTALPGYLFQGRSWKLLALDYGYHLTGLLVGGAILSVWR